MYLKRLELRGFKTFADRTELHFGPGLTGIVGPNGVGKSNIADAIVWALGEQSQRAIRTQTSQDVIFAGSEKRRPLGMAEVRLLLDNEDGALPLDFSEVEVYRRLYRSGESEYGINNSSCRLRDIHDLFVDTGVGQSAYSLVGQGDVEAILSARSETRRELMEEVAGTGKYRRRRQEAQRKLEEIEANVRRISDIIYELSSQREPLEKQAEKARAYRALDEQLRGLELTLLALDYQERQQRLGKLANDEQILRAEIEGTRSQLNLADAEIERIAAILHELETELAAVRERARTAEREADQVERACAVTTEKLRAIEDRLAELAGTGEGETDRERELAESVEKLRERQQQYRTEADELAGRLQALRAELEAAEQQRRERARRITQAREQHAELLRVAEGAVREAEALASIRDELQERIQRLEAQREELRARQQEAERKVAAVQAERDAAAAQAEEVRRRFERHSALHGALTRTLRDHRAKCNILAGAAAAAEARLALLEELERGHDGYRDPVRAVLEAAARGELSGVHGVVADMLEVPARYETAIEAALGERLQWVVVDTQEQAVAAVEYLRQQGLGYATFLPLGSLSMVPAQAPLASGDGCLGLASRLIKAAPKMSLIVEHLLSDVAVMRDLPSALRLTRRIGYQARAVTLDGTVVERNGAIGGGTLGQEGGHAFSRRRERERVAAELEELRHYLAAAYECEERLEKAARELAALVERGSSGSSERRARLSELDRDLIYLRDQAEAASAAVAELEGEIEGLRGRLAQTAERIESSRAQAEQAAAQAAELQRRLEEEPAEELREDELQPQRAELVQLEVGLAEMREKERSAAELVRQQEEELRRLRSERENRSAVRQTLTEQQAALRSELATLASTLGQRREVADRLGAEVSQRHQDVAEMRAKSEELEASTRKLRRILDGQQEALSQLEVLLTREQAQIEHIQERLTDVYEVTPEQALEQLHNASEVNRNALARQVNQLKRDMRALGHVNLSAIDEYERLRAREQFLADQRDDLEQAREDLLEIIEEIDTAAEAEFLAVFEQIRAAFAEVFTQLFGGGTTQLYLTDPDHPLQAGVEVMAQPPGKRQKHLSLLSGGERALTALALLFAMLKVKPSPFCVLDEIDASLDEANTDRFVALLREFAQRSQFIVITHNPRTMEAMELLHGITMQEAGVSQRISVELADAQEEGRREQRRRAAAQSASSADEGRDEEPVAAPGTAGA